MEVLVNYLGRAVCHQFTARTFSIVEPLPVCARCTGIFVGVAVSHLFFALYPAKTRVLPLMSISFALIVLMLPLGVDGATSYLGFRDTTNLIRLATGLLMGLSLPILYIPLFSKDPRTVPGQSLNWKDLGMIIAASTVVGTALYYALPASWWLWSMMIAAGHLLLYLSVIRLVLSRFGLSWLWSLAGYVLFVVAMNWGRSYLGV